MSQIDSTGGAVSAALPLSDAAAPPATSTRRRPRIGRQWRNPIGIIGAVIVLITIVTALAAPIIAPYAPDDSSSDRLLGPSRDNLLGTDELGRDTFSRIVYGARASLQVSIIAVLVALLAGGFLGLISAYYGGWIDGWVMRLVDILFAFPGLVLAIVIAGLLGPSRNNAMIAIGVAYAPAFARVIRGSVLSVMNEPYLESGRVAGAGAVRLIGRHILPNITAPTIVLTTVYLSSAVLAEAGLSFLGLGTQPPDPSWGGMLNASRSYMERAPWMAISPGLAIMFIVLGLNFLGDGLRDILDPRLRSR
jgi:peptide/nickel transport system permease protein